MVKWYAWKKHFTKKDNIITAITESWLKVNETFSGKLPPEEKIKVFIGDTFTTLSSEGGYYFVNLPNKEKIIAKTGNTITVGKQSFEYVAYNDYISNSPEDTEVPYTFFNYSDPNLSYLATNEAAFRNFLNSFNLSLATVIAYDVSSKFIMFGKNNEQLNYNLVFIQENAPVINCSVKYFETINTQA